MWRGGVLSNKLYPEPYPGEKLPDPAIGVLRPGDVKLQAAGLVRGAKVTVMVNESTYLKNSPGIMYAHEVTALEEESIIDLLYPLQDQQHVYLIQKLCDRTSSLKAPANSSKKDISKSLSTHQAHSRRVNSTV